MDEEREASRAMKEFLLTGKQLVWYRRLFPWLPIWSRNKEMRTFTFQLTDCSVTHKSLIGPHCVDVLIRNHRKWWQLKYIGFELWF